MNNEENLIKIEGLKRIEIKNALIKFLENTDFILSEDYELFILKKGFWNQLLNKPNYINLFIYDNFIDVKTNKKCIELTKKLFEDFVKIYPIKVNISVNDDNDYY